jgi:hypothetical protein
MNPKRGFSSTPPKTQKGPHGPDLFAFFGGGGTVWRCLAYSDGTVGDLAVQSAMDDGGGAMDGGYGGNEGGFTATRQIRFQPGRSAGEWNDGLTPGSSTR